jgi:hypothetical protein
LLVVPAVFTYIDDIEHWLLRLIGKERPGKIESAPVTR